MSMFCWLGQGWFWMARGRCLLQLNRLMLWALPAPPDDTVYGNSGVTLYTINTSTGAATGAGTLSFTTNGIARDPVSGRVY